MEESDYDDDVNKGERVYSKHTYINIQTYKCSTHQSYPYSAFLASERRRERETEHSLSLFTNSPTKFPIKRRKMSNEEEEWRKYNIHDARSLPTPSHSNEEYYVYPFDDRNKSDDELQTRCEANFCSAEDIGTHLSRGDMFT